MSFSENIANVMFFDEELNFIKLDIVPEWLLKTLGDLAPMLSHLSEHQMTALIRVLEHLWSCVDDSASPALSRTLLVTLTIGLPLVAGLAYHETDSSANCLGVCRSKIVAAG